MTVQWTTTLRRNVGILRTAPLPLLAVASLLMLAIATLVLRGEPGPEPLSSLAAVTRDLMIALIALFLQRFGPGWKRWVPRETAALVVTCTLLLMALLPATWPDEVAITSTISAYLWWRGLFLGWAWLQRMRHTKLQWALTYQAALYVLLGSLLLGVVLASLLVITAFNTEMAEVFAAEVAGTPFSDPSGVLRVGIGLIILLAIAVLSTTAAVIVALPVALFSHRFLRRTTVRLAQLVDATRNLREGNLTTRVRIQGADEVAQLQTAFNTMASELQTTLDERNRANADLAAQRDKITQLLAERRALIAAVSHELRTPVAAVRGYIESLQSAMAHGPRTTDHGPRTTDVPPQQLAASSPTINQTTAVPNDDVESSGPTPSSIVHRPSSGPTPSSIVHRPWTATASSSVVRGPSSDGSAINHQTPPTLAADLAIMHAETVRLQRLIDDLFTLARTEAGGLALTLEPTDVAVLLERCAAAARQGAWARGRVEVLVAEFPTLPAAHADAGRLEQIISNVIQNAVRHTPPGGVVLLSAAADANAVTITISDTGAGIDPADLPHVFTRFYRADDARAADATGAGLGLALVKELSEAMGGSVDIESTPGQGTSVRVRLGVADHGPRTTDHRP